MDYIDWFLELRYNMFSKDIQTDISVDTHVFATANSYRGLL